MQAAEDDTGADEVPQPIPPNEALAEALRAIAAAISLLEEVPIDLSTPEHVAANVVVRLKLTEALTILRLEVGADG